MALNYINVLMLGDLIGNPGINQVALKLSQIKNKEKINLVIVNGENSDDGFGITEDIINSIKKSGVDIITSGNHIWSNDDADYLLNNFDYLLRPANYPNLAGKGWFITNIGGINIGVVNLLGRYHMTPINCPFQTLKKLLNKELKECKIIIVDFHAESSAEKKALAYDFDGRIALLAGTHTHVQTADEMILPNGTGYITDLGICGGLDSVIGMEKDDVLKKILSQSVIPFSPSNENPEVQGIVAKIDINTKKTVEIKRIKE